MSETVLAGISNVFASDSSSMISDATVIYQDSVFICRTLTLVFFAFVSEGSDTEKEILFSLPRLC